MTRPISNLVASVALTFSQLLPTAPVVAQSRDTAATVTAPGTTTATTAPATTTPATNARPLPGRPVSQGAGGSGGSGGGGSGSSGGGSGSGGSGSSGGGFGSGSSGGGSGSGWSGGSGGSSGGGWGSGGGNSGWNQLTCESWNYQYRRCPANTRNNVELTRRIAGNCVAGRTWGFDRNNIWVDGGCRAQFRFGASGGGGGGSNWGRGYAGQLRCESWNYAFRRCSSNTNGRVDLLRTVAGTCQFGRSWGFDNGGIWVNHGCRGDFGFGYGNNNGNGNNNGGGSNTGEVIAGVALAAGLIALLAAGSNSKGKSTPAQINVSAPPAQIVANLASIPADRRPSVQTCLNEAARQIGATGGTQISLDRVSSLKRVSAGWELRAQLVTSYPDESRTVDMTCRADGEQLLAIDFGQ